MTRKHFKLPKLATTQNIATLDLKLALTKLKLQKK